MKESHDDVHHIVKAIDSAREFVKKPNDSIDGCEKTTSRRWLVSDVKNIDP